MWYEINVSLNGVHFFTTNERLVSYYSLKKVLPVILEKFPESEGYEISVKEVSEIRKHIEVNDVLSGDGK